MRHLVLCIGFTLLFTDCAHHTAVTSKATLATPVPKIEQHPQNVKTSEARRKQLSDDYHHTMVFSILDLDDGVTSPEIVARAALSRAGDRYRAWKQATVGEDLNLKTSYEREAFESILSDFPNQNTVDLWSGFVLEARKKNQKILPKGRDRMRELGID